ncbi:MAG: class I SAM-dependent methyltransferase [Ferruginibacter sp.]
MASISDSNAVLEKKRLLSQHHAVLTLIHGQVVKPTVTRYKWLDLCCGQGQIIVNLEDNFNVTLREKIEYHIQDINEEYLRVTQKKAESLSLNKVQCFTTDIYSFPQIIPLSSKYDFITLINAVHEISPIFFPVLFLEALLRLNQKGTLYVYDMETIKPPELGAVSWTREEVQEIINSILSFIAAENYEPNVSRWNHSSCNAWSFEVQKEFVISDEEILKIRDAILANSDKKIKELLNRKKGNCEKALESYLKYGTETAEDEEKKRNLLYDFYSLNRIINL